MGSLRDLKKDTTVIEKPFRVTRSTGSTDILKNSLRALRESLTIITREHDRTRTRYQSRNAGVETSQESFQLRVMIINSRGASLTLKLEMC